MKLTCAADNDIELSLCRVIASAAASSPHVCTDHRRPLVGSSHKYHVWKKGATLFAAITLAFLGQLLSFLYHWKQE